MTQIYLFRRKVWYRGLTSADFALFFFSCMHSGILVNASSIFRQIKYGFLVHMRAGLKREKEA